MAKPFIKPIITPEQAAGKVTSGDSLMVGGFNYAGAPYTLIGALAAALSPGQNLAKGLVMLGNTLFSGFGEIVRKAPYVSGAVILLIGLYLGINGWLHLPAA